MALITPLHEAKRFEQIVSVLVDEGFGFLVERVHKDKQPQKPMEKRLVAVLERLGPTFIKFGQMLSVRPDLVPPDYIRALEELQDEVPAEDYTTIKQVAEEALGAPIEEHFGTFSKEPMASASISQVHEATLKDGTTVVVKIRRPHIVRQMQTDIKLMRRLVPFVDKHFDIPGMRAVDFVDEFEQWTNEELHFKKEMQNAIRFRTQFRDNESVFVPQVFPELSSDQLLVLEKVPGKTLNHLPPSVEIEKILERSFDVVMEQMLIHGFFHADPHPGNLFVLPDGRIGFVDFGIMGYFDAALKQDCIDLYLALIYNDVEKGVDTLLDLNKNTTQIDRLSLERDLQGVFMQFQTRLIKDVHMLSAFLEMAHTGTRHGLRFPREFALYAKTLTVIEGIAYEYNPDLDFKEHAMDFALKLERVRLRGRTQSVRKGITDFSRNMAALPSRINGALRTLEQGQIGITLDKEEVRSFILDMDRSSNRISYGMIIASLFIGSAILQATNTGPTVASISVFAGLGLLAAVFMGTIMLVSIIREGW